MRKYIIVSIVQTDGPYMMVRALKLDRRSGAAFSPGDGEAATLFDSEDDAKRALDRTESHWAQHYEPIVRPPAVQRVILPVE